MRIHRGIISILLMVSGHLAAQNTINGGEYWIDSDFNGRSTLSFSSPVDLEYQAAIDIQSLVNGLHIIHYRFSDGNNNWSSVASKFFIKKQDISGSVARDVVAYEYWIDSDFENRMEDTPPSVHDFNLMTNLDVAGLINGLHTVHYRFKDSEEVWSSVLSRFFVKKQTLTGSVTKEIVSYEYWFDADFDNRTEHSIGNSIVFNLAEDLDVSMLPDGLHTLHYRFKDSDHIWSSVISEYIVCKAGDQVFSDNNIVAYRYWFNSDTMREVELDNHIQNLAFEDTLEMYTYRKGDYFISLQFKDEQGLWSAPLTDTVEKIGFPIAAIQSFPSVVCDTATIDFLSMAYDADTLLWTINDVPVPGDTSLSYFFSQTGEYDVLLTAIDTVLDIDSSFLAKVIVYDAPVVDLGGDQSIPENDALELDAGTGFISYQWYDNDDERIKIISGPTLGTGDHQVFVMVTDANSCIGSDTITISVTAALGSGESGTRGIRIYPVPVQEHLNIEIPENMLGTCLRIYNSAGQIMNERNLENEITVIDMSRFTSGYYMLTFTNREHVYQKTIVLSR